MVDAPGLGPDAAGRAGSIPVPRTIPPALEHFPIPITIFRKGSTETRRERIAAPSVRSLSSRTQKTVSGDFQQPGGIGHPEIRIHREDQNEQERSSGFNPTPRNRQLVAGTGAWPLATGGLRANAGGLIAGSAASAPDSAIAPGYRAIEAGIGGCSQLAVLPNAKRQQRTRFTFCR